MLHTLFSIFVFTCILIVIGIIYALKLRRVVPTNEVHIVQSSNNTFIYGKEAPDNEGNSYWQIPVWVPRYGVCVTKLPATIQDVTLEKCKIFDRDALEFGLTIKAFFRIINYNKTGGCIFKVSELQNQLRDVIHCVALGVFSKEPLDKILVGFTEYNDLITKGVQAQVKEWGIDLIKPIEITDIQDVEHNTIIETMKTKRLTEVETKLRKTIAEAEQRAKEAEISVKQQIAITEQEAHKEVELKKAEVKQEIQTQVKQAVKTELEVKQIQEVQAAEIEKQAAEIKAQINDMEGTNV